MKLKVGISNRHVHFSESDYKTLFGDEEVKVLKPLTQPLQYVTDKVVTLKTEKNEINNVRFLGPFRLHTQVEISKSDAYYLGLNPPVRNSSDLTNSETITIVGPKGEITKENCCIIATRHIHVSEVDKDKFDENKKYKIIIDGEKKTVFYNVYAKIGNFNTEVHLDMDDANAAFIKNGDEVTVLEE